VNTDTHEQRSAERSSAATSSSRNSEAREIGRLDLGEALELTALVVLRDRDRGWQVVLVAAAPLAALRAASARQPSR
jgi:hypothetical protein